MPLLNVKQVTEVNNTLAILVAHDRANKIVLASAVRIRLAGILRKTKPTAVEWEEVRNDLFKKYGTVNSKDELSVNLSSPNRAEFDKDFNGALAETTEVNSDSFGKITHKELFGEVQKHKDGDKPENQVDLDVVSTLLEYGILQE